MQIGEVAKRTSLTVDAIRFYEKRKLLPNAVRSAGRFRLRSIIEPLFCAKDRIEREKGSLALGRISAQEPTKRLLKTNGISHGCTDWHGMSFAPVIAPWNR